jgi:hypothetical protein
MMLVLTGLLLAPAARALAQGANPLDNPRLQQLLATFWHPVVGSGAVYETTEKDGGRKRTMELTVVGKESVEGKEAYWLEVAMQSPDMSGTIYAKDLMIPGEFRPLRVIFQLPGSPAMEMPLRPNPNAKLHLGDKKTTKVGSETILVPAGSFVCDHWKADQTDVWVSSKVSPLTVVKSVSQRDTQVLVKTLTNVKDHITGPVQPFDPMVMRGLMNGRGRGSN